jgi:hypothetical protein
MSPSRVPGFSAEEALLPVSGRYQGVPAASGPPGVVRAQQGFPWFWRGGAVFGGGVLPVRPGGPGTVFLTVHECLRLGGTVALHEWCSTGLKCVSGIHEVCIDEGVVKG